MNPYFNDLRGCFLQAGVICNCGERKLRSTFGLDDFLTNSVQEEDDSSTLAIKALLYFCEGTQRQEPQYQIAVLAVAVFLERTQAKRTGNTPPIQATRDLVAILEKHGVDETAIRGWVSSHFG